MFNTFFCAVLKRIEDHKNRECRFFLFLPGRAYASTVLFADKKWSDQKKEALLFFDHFFLLSSFFFMRLHMRIKKKHKRKIKLSSKNERHFQKRINVYDIVKLFLLSLNHIFYVPSLEHQLLNILYLLKIF